MAIILHKIGPLPAQFRPANLDPPPLSRPLSLCKVPAGFPSPARDYKGKSLDLNVLLIKNKPATFFWEVSGESMREVGIHDGDTLVVDRSIDPRHGDVVVAEINGDVVVKRLYMSRNVIELQPANPNFLPIQFQEGDYMEVWGVVTSFIHIFKT